MVITSGGEARKLMMARALYKTPPSCCWTNPPAAPDPVSEYEVYRRFSHISGGEARKLMMARALYKTPPSCCWTNPPAAPDPVSEYEVYRRFSHISGGRTSV